MMFEKSISSIHNTEHKPRQSFSKIVYDALTAIKSVYRQKKNGRHYKTITFSSSIKI